jgi:Fe2+ transport system protein FeoA
MQPKPSAEAFQSSLPKLRYCILALASPDSQNEFYSEYLQKKKNQRLLHERIGRILKYDKSSRIFSVPPFERPSESSKLSVLSDLNVGESGVLVDLDLPESVQNHLMHMGFVPDALVTVLRRAPAGDPTVYSVDGMEIALRHETSAAIRMRPAQAEVPQMEASQ